MCRHGNTRWHVTGTANGVCPSTRALNLGRVHPNWMSAGMIHSPLALRAGSTSSTFSLVAPPSVEPGDVADARPGVVKP